MWIGSPEALEFSEAWIDGDDTARWRSAPGHGPAKGAAESGSSLLEVDEGRRLPRHVDTAEETIVVLSGRAEVEVAGERAEVRAGGIALVPKEVPHEVRNVGSETLRFVAIYAGTDVVTRYEQPVQPAGDAERAPFE